MRRSVRLHPEAETDIEEATSWYASRSHRAAVWFLDELDRMVNLIAESPEHYPFFEGDLRRATFRRFPFYAVFRAGPTQVTVIAIAHGKRCPGFWSGRN